MEENEKFATEQDKRDVAAKGAPLTLDEAVLRGLLVGPYSRAKERVVAMVAEFLYHKFQDHKVHLMLHEKELLQDLYEDILKK